jgi:hypothetical protein
MPRFRLRSGSRFSSPVDVREVIADAVRPAQFFEGRTIRLEWEHVARQDISWEIFEGRLLDPAHTRRRQSFEAWNVFRLDAGGRSSEPLLSVKLDAVLGLVYVTRAICCYVQEGYHAGGNIYLSREVQKWVRELTGTIVLARVGDAEEFRDELACQLFQAVVGTSRLPLTSVESPLPEFTLGELGYFYRSSHAQGSSERLSEKGTGLLALGQELRTYDDRRGVLSPFPTASEPMRSFNDLVELAWQEDLCWLERVKLLELLLRATPCEHLDDAAATWVERLRALHTEGAIPALLRNLFDEVALSPYTDFVAQTMEFLVWLEQRGGWSVEAHVDFLSYLLRQLGRHLTAYDLVTFHHRGANYPDILLLDAALRRYLTLIERQPGLFRGAHPRGRLRRRALRQAWLLRRHYEGHLVPDAPTSPGENVRILPPPHARVPDQQIADPTRRTRRLFADDPLSVSPHSVPGDALRQSLRDLEHSQELQELGTAIFLDRPLGVFKRPGEPDQTLLLSYETFSRSIARQRLRELADQWGVLDSPQREALEQRLHDLMVEGTPVDQPAQPARPGSVALTDACRVADDFVALCTTSRSVRDFLGLFDFTPLADRFTLDYLTQGRRVMILRTPTAGQLRILDEQFHCRLELQVDPEEGYDRRGGIEFPAPGLQVVRVWESAEDGLREHQLPDMILRPL